MAYFAQIDNNNVVTQVIAISNTVCPDPAPENEQMGISYIHDVLQLPGTWLQTSFNGSFRYNFASVDGTYDATNDAFIGLQPFASWVLNNKFVWVSPTPHPTTPGMYVWNEQTQMWELLG